MFYGVVRKEKEITQNINPHSLLAAGLFHDYGKVFIPDEILNKKGKHNSEERKIMESHNRLAFASKELNSLEKNFLPHLREIAVGHHPYPRGRNTDRRGVQRREIMVDNFSGERSGTDRRQKARRENNPYVNRAAALLDICDDYDALCSKRDYKPAFPREKVRKILTQLYEDETKTIEFLIRNYSK